MYRGIRIILFAGLALLTSVETSAQQKEDETLIQAQALGSALQVLADEYDLQVLFESAVVANHTARVIPQGMSSDAALGELLSGTDLTYEFVNERTVAIRGEEDEATSEGEGGNSDSKNLRSKPTLAVQETVESRESDGDEEGASRRIRTRDDVEADEEASREGRGQIETITVVGTRNVGIRRYEDDAQPYVIFDATQIETSFASDIEEFLRTRLPMDQSVGFARNPGVAGDNRSSINLRGLGEDQTLILVNGRRLPSVDPDDPSGAGFAQPDLNGIPLSAVERIEVLPATASGIYGGGATGGVINIILRRGYVGADVAFTYDNTFETDSAQRRFDASAGFTLEDGRTSVLISASYSDANPLLVGDRSFAADGRALMLANDPDRIFNASTPPIGFTTNIRSLDGSDLVLDNDVSLGSPITFVPIGYEGALSDGGAALLANAGQYNLELSNDTSGARRALINSPAVTSLSLNARREFTPQLELFTDLIYGLNEGQSVRDGGLPSVAFLPADAPTNPFSSNILVSIPYPGIEATSTTENETIQAVFGGRYQISDSWAVEVEHNWGQSNRRSMDFSSFLASSNTSQAITSGALDVLRDVNAFPLDLTQFQLDPNVNERRNNSSGTSLRASGELSGLPAGPIVASALLEHRRQESDDTSFFIPLFDVSFFAAGFSEDVLSAYGELLIPLINEAANVPGIHGLEVQLSARFDSYDQTFATDRSQARFVIDPDGPPPEIDRRSTDRTSTDYTFALRYQPIENLVLRGSYATGFIVPTIGELVPFFIDDFTTSLVDPERGGKVQLLQGITRITGGNPDLEPEDAESFSIGARYEPTWLPGFSMSADYTLIEKKGEIARLSFEEILALFPERVQRAPLEPDAPAGYTAGPIMQIDDSFFNLAASRAEAWDFQVDYVRETVDFGRFSLFAVATWQPELSEQATPDDPMENSIGFRGSPVEWRGNAGIVWEGGPWTLGWNTQYFDSYSVLFQVFTLPQFASSAEREIRAQGRSQIDAQFYHDAFASYAFGASPAFGGTLLENVEFRVGIQNVFEEKTPPIASVNPTSAIYPVTDPRLRTYSVSLRKSF